MVDLDLKSKMVPSDLPKFFSDKLRIPLPHSSHSIDLSAASDSACSAYEQFLRLPELKQLWSSKEFPNWKSESVLKPALQALEITFRLISTIFSDHKPYTNRREWTRKLESLSTNQLHLIALLFDDSESIADAPITDQISAEGVVARGGSSAEVWKLDRDTVVVSRISESSLLPRLATWHKSEQMARKIHYSIECEMIKCPYTLGLGEPNLAGKPNLDCDFICKPPELHRLNKTQSESKNLNGTEFHVLHTTHQILESWMYVARELLKRIGHRIDSRDLERASSDCFILETIWKVLDDIEGMNLLIDPDDFLRMKKHLEIGAGTESESLWFRSRALVEITKLSKDLRHRVPYILGVEVDPKGGPRIQEAAMKLYREKDCFEKIHLLQGLQGIESAVKKFYFSYKQLIGVVMGSLEAKGNGAFVSLNSNDSLSQIFLAPTYYPSLDGAKTFLGDYWSRECGDYSRERRTVRD